MDRPDRPLVRQLFYASPLIAPASPARTQLSQAVQQASLDTLITAFTVSCPFGGANSVWIGDSSVDATLFNGIEIPPGISKSLVVDPGRQLYELQQPLLDSAPCLIDALAIPFAVWDLSGWYITASAQITVGLVLFPEMFK